MKLEDLECFLEVARHRNMTTAAKALNLAQSTVSDRISGLEAYLGGPLFERSARDRRLKLTASGKRLRSIACRLSSVALDIRTQARAQRAKPEPLHIGVNESVAHVWLGSWLSRLRLELPQLAFDVKVGTTDELDALMVGGALDLAIGTRAFGYRPIKRRRLAALPMVFVGNSSRHARPEYSLRELAAEGLITFQLRSAPQRALLELLRAEGLEGCRVDTVSSVGIMLRLVEEGAGVATLPRALAEAAQHPQVRILRCRAKLPPLPLWLSWRNPRSSQQLPAALQNLLAFVEQTPTLATPE
jgi:DNA-binding transcriptional LysR family regulator